MSYERVIQLYQGIVDIGEEEAGIPREIASRVQSVGAVSYVNYDSNTCQLKRDVLFCYDLDLSEYSRVPTPVDGEVESFELQTISWVLAKLIEGGVNGYKPNCNIVIIDFMIRYGIYDEIRLLVSMYDTSIT